ncbi:hypothetical protein D3C78_1113270 [compost metagenome]
MVVRVLVLLRTAQSKGILLKVCFGVRSLGNAQCQSTYAWFDLPGASSGLMSIDSKRGQTTTGLPLTRFCTKSTAVGTAACKPA